MERKRRKPKYIYWLENETPEGNRAGIGEWFSLKEVKKAKKQIEKMTSRKNIIKKYPPMKCPRCGRWTNKETIQSLGECLNCDHLRGEIYD